jgi:hypothetical protein
MTGIASGPTTGRLYARYLKSETRALWLAGSRLRRKEMTEGDSSCRKPGMSHKTGGEGDSLVKVYARKNALTYVGEQYGSTRTPFASPCRHLCSVFDRLDGWTHGDLFSLMDRIKDASEDVLLMTIEDRRRNPGRGRRSLGDGLQHFANCEHPSLHEKLHRRGTSIAVRFFTSDDTGASRTSDAPASFLCSSFQNPQETLFSGRLLPLFPSSSRSSRWTLSHQSTWGLACRLRLS